MPHAPHTGSQDYFDVLAPDASVRHKYIPAIMLNAQGVNICDPKLGGVEGAGAGTAFEDDRIGGERTHNTSRTLHNAILFKILFIRDFIFFFTVVFLDSYFSESRKSRRSSTSTPTPPATASTALTASTVISGGHKLHKIRFNFLDSVGLVGWQLLWIADGTEGSLVLRTSYLYCYCWCWC